MLVLALLPQADRIQVAAAVWILLWLGLASLALYHLVRILTRPQPQTVQSAVKAFILMYIVMDAVICLGFAGWRTAIAVLALLLPTLLASRWAPMT